MPNYFAVNLTSVITTSFHYGYFIFQSNGLKWQWNEVVFTMTLGNFNLYEVVIITREEWSNLQLS